MERFELEPKLKEEIRARVLGEGFMKIVQTVRRNGKQFKIAMRPVEIGGEKKFQAEMTDDGQVQVKNLDVNAAAEGLEEIIAQRGARDMHLMTAKGDLHMRVTKKGHVMVTRSAEMDRVVTVQPHDRVKKVPLTSFDSAALLRTIGLADGSGKIRASMRGKYDQVNEFLKVVGTTLGENVRNDECSNVRMFDCSNDRNGRAGEHFEHSNIQTFDHCFTVVDCGCGKAYLTISLYFYLTEVLKFPNVKVIGIDRRSDVIAAAKKMAAQLDVADKVEFVESDLGEYQLEKADMVVSLHACDTATDEALAKGVEWKARYILSAPCRQHELQKELGNNRIGECSNVRMGECSNNRMGGRDAASDFAGLLRQSILRERMCDILTDSFRAMILRILGFKTQVIEFVSSEATARNIMLKCEYGVKPGQPGPIGEYLNLRDYWKVTPWLETRLEKLLGKYFERYE